METTYRHWPQLLIQHPITPVKLEGGAAVSSTADAMQPKEMASSGDESSEDVDIVGLKEGKWEMISSGEAPCWRSHAETAQQLPAAGDADMTTGDAVLSARQAPMAGPATEAEDSSFVRSVLMGGPGEDREDLRADQGVLSAGGGMDVLAGDCRQQCKARANQPERLSEHGSDEEGEESEGDDPTDADYLGGPDRPGPSKREKHARQLLSKQHTWPECATQPKACAEMRGLLVEVLDALEKGVTPDILEVFKERVSPASVPDYRVHVAATDEVWLSLIRKRAKNGTHYSLESLVRDFEQMAANARIYNTPGKGRWGDTDIIKDAETILSVVKREIELRAAQFAALTAQTAPEAACGVNIVANCATGSMQANTSADESSAAREHQDIDQQDGTAAVAGPPSGTEGGPPALAGGCQRSELQRQGSGVPLSELIAARRAAVRQASVGDPGEQDPAAVVPAGGPGGLQPRQPSAAQLIPAHTQPMQQPAPASDANAVPQNDLIQPLGLAPAIPQSSGVEKTPAPRQPAR
ncbi:hypothetical protein COCSUDRAFT_58808 [Coccomyxa subellipsoidea C-169]|uniref:Bromo domain-containing protein n=1 Tax=Coccomyxa subellipsoidea (strain C-169) TaxID=574566 RepID=I0Z6J7_COCSC|nr:hypothetical protein COCSUDRAFT_58808 [Coccomyxa subellipsoidea C-169]EIE26266.1 hypothetical protein COCSUDRAFT_58808 [Coccomyxa subellipsoidea C-169]|eukprot:XP_005650810.1 hypothetical protein COCSUDRAFT_58808 [Coccomyxa subellipsoidea C-169]